MYLAISRVYTRKDGALTTITWALEFYTYVQSSQIFAGHGIAPFTTHLWYPETKTKKARLTPFGS
jgi:hypothetical protein